MNRKTKLGFVVFLLAVVAVGFYLVRTPNNVALRGQLRQADGTTAQDGFYDLRVVGFDKETGAQVISQDFADIAVQGGEYELPLQISRFADEGENYFQVCRTDEPSDAADGLDDDAPEGCKDAVEQQKVFTFAECPQTIQVSTTGGFVSKLLGVRQVQVDGGCTYVATASELNVEIPLAPSSSTSPSIPVVGEKGDQGSQGSAGERGEKGEKGDKGDTGEQGEAGADGATGARGPAGPAGDPATDDQTLSFGGASILSIAGGNTVDLSSLLDNTDELAALACGDGEVPLMTLGVWACGTAAGVDTDDQTLSLIANVLAIDSGNSVNLAGYLDNTDGQTLSYVAGTQSLTIAGGNTVNLSSLLDNTDAQDLSLAGTTLSLTGDGTTVSLASLLDNTDVLASLSCSNGQVAKWNGSAWICAADNDTNTDTQDLSLAGNILSLVDGGSVDLSVYLDDTVLNETQVDAYVANNGYLTSEVDGSISNELQNLTFASNVIGLTSSGTTFDLSGYLDNTDVLASLSCGNGQVPQWNGSAWICASTAVDTDDQTLSLVANTLSIDSGNSVSLSTYLDNTDAQSIALAGNIISISGNASTVDLSAYLDNTDSQTLSLGGNTLSLVSGGSVDLSLYLDNTDAQDLSLAGSTLSLTGDGTTVSLASFLDNTDVLAGLSCNNNEIPKWNGSAWACAADVDTVLNESAVDAYVANNGYLTTEVDGSVTNELQDLTFASNVLGLTDSGVSFDLSAYLDNTDTQDISLVGNTLSLVDGGSVSLAAYLDNTDAQSIAVASNVLSISGNASTVDLSPYLDNTDAQTLNYVTGTQTLSIGGGNSVSLSTLLDNTDAQDLSIAGSTLSLTGDGTSVSLAAFLDNTDAQDLSLSLNTLSLTGDGTTVDLSAYLDNTDLLASLSCSTGEVAQWNGSAWICASAAVDTDDQTLTYTVGTQTLTIADGNSVSLSALLDNTDSQAISLVGNTVSITGNVSTIDLSGYLDNTDAQDLTLTGNTLSLTGDGSTVDLSAYLDDTVLNEAQVDAYVANNGYLTSEVDGSITNEIQDLSLAVNILSLTGDGTTVDLSPYLDNTDSQTLSYVAGTQTLSIGGGNSVSLSTLLDNTDAQTLSLVTNTLSITGGNSVDLSGYLDNTDNQNLFLTINTDNGTDPVADGSSDTLNLSSGSGVTITGDGTTDTITVAATLGTTIDSTEIVDGAIVSADIADGTITGTDVSDGSIGNADLVNSSVTVTAGTGLTGGGAISLGGTVTINLANDFGSSIDSSEITNGTILTADIAADQITSALIANGEITNADIADSTIANAKLVNSAVTVTAGTGLSGGGTVALGGTISLTSSLGTDIDTSEITNGTILFADLATNGCGTGQIIEYNGSAWVCGTDDGLTSEVDGNVTNELQNLFETISTPAGTNPVADGLTDTLSFANGSGVTITGDGTTDTITIAATLGVSIDSSEIVDGTVSNTDLANSSVTVNTGTGLSGGGAVSLGGTLNLTSTLGTAIDTSEIVDGTIVLADFSNFGCGTGDIIEYNGSAWVCGSDDVNDADSSATNELQNLFLTIDTPNGTDPVADGQADTLAFADGAGITITGNGTTDTITIATTLGTSIDSSEITDGTIVFADLASNSCNTGEVIKFNGSAWICGTDNDTAVSEATVEAFIFDADNTGTLSSGTLALDSLSYTGTLDDANVNDALTISSSGSVADGALSANVSLLGNSIESSEIANGTVTGTDLASATILFSNIAQNGCGSGDVMKWNGSAWACATDIDTDTDAQSLFQTINTDNGTDPVADGPTDTLNLVSGSGVTITGDGTTDTITVAATLGTTIDSAEIVDGTIVSADISDGSIANADLANSAVTVTAGTGLTGGGAVSLGGTVTLNLANDFGASIDSSEITNGTILTADIAADQITSALIANGEIVNADIADSTIANAKLVNSAVTVTAGVGLSGGGTVALGGSVSLTSSLGTDIDTSEITNGTILFADLATNGCGTGQIIEYNGSAWVCGADDGITSEVDGSTTNELQNIFETIATPAGTNPVADGTTDTLSFANGSGVTITGDGTTDTITIAATLGVSIDSTEIVDGTVANTDLANSSVTVNTGSGLSGGGSVSLGGTLNLTSTLGTDISSAEIVDGTIVLADFSNFGCGTGDIIEYNGSAWVCASDDVNDADSSATNELQNLFLTIDTPNGTDPVADGQTDTLAFANGSGVTITGDGTTDTITIAATLGTDITSAEIVDGTVGNNDLANSAVTVTAGNGLANGGSVALGSSTTLNIGAGNGIAVAADSIAVAVAGSADGLSSTTSSGSGLEVLASGVTLLQGCSNNQILKWSETTDVWACANDIDTDTDAQDLSLSSNTLSLTNDGTTVDLSGYLDNTDAQDLTLTGNTLALTGDGTTVDLSAYLDDTDTLASLSCSPNEIAKWNGSAWACAVDVDTDTQDLSLASNTLSLVAGGSVDLSGYLDNTDAQDLTLTGNTLALTGDGTSVDLSGYLDNTDAQSLFFTFDVDNGTDPQADSASDTLVLVSGAGVTITGNSTTDTITVAAALGATIDNSSEIVDGTIANADLANSAVTVTAGNGLANGGSVSLGGTTTLNIGAGNGITVNADDITIDLTTATDGLSAATSSSSGLEVLASGLTLIQGCSNNQILKWNEASDVWACANDVDTDAQDLTLVTNTLSLTGDGTSVDLSAYLDNTDNQNLFFTINADNGTDPVADGATDTLNFISGAGVTVTGDGTTDTLTIAATLGATIDNSSEIVDGTIANADLANSSVTVTAGNGLTTGGAVSLGGTVTLDIGAGTGITVNANDIAITADGLNFTELSDTLALDASTTISLGANNFTTNLSGTGDYAIQFAGNTVFQILDTGAVTIGSILADQTIGIDNGTGTINIATDTDANATNIGTGTGADTVTIGDSNANVAITDAQWSISGAGAASFASLSGAGLTDCDTQTSKLLWDSATGQFSCGTDRASASVRKSANESVTSSTALQDDNELLFAANVSETWVYEVSFIYTTGASATPDIRVGMNGPAGSTCVYQASDIAHAGNANAGATACNTAISLPTTATGTRGGQLSGSITTGGTAGNAVFRWAQNTSNATSTTVVAGSSLTAFKLTGADYAETYFTQDETVQKGQLVELTGDGRSQVRKSSQAYGNNVIGIVSTQPGQVVGAADGFGYPVQIALAGRVPIKLTTENGLPIAGDMITASGSRLGYGMKATQSGQIVGQLMMNAVDNGDGTADGFVFVRSGFWQAPVSIDMSDIFGQTAIVATPQAQDEQDLENELGLEGISSQGSGYTSFDQSLVDAMRNGFSLQQEAIADIRTRVERLELNESDQLLFDDSIVFDESQVTFLKRVTFAQGVTFEKPVTLKDSAGSVIVPASQTQLQVVFPSEYPSAPKILLSPNEFLDGSWRVKDITRDGFMIEFALPQQKDIEMTWQAVLTE